MEGICYLLEVKGANKLAYILNYIDYDLIFWL